MPLAKDIYQLPEGIEVHLPEGDWDPDEKLFVKAVYDGFSQQAALVAARVERKDPKGNTVYSMDNEVYQRSLIVGHIVPKLTTLRNAPNAVQKSRNQRGNVVKWTAENIGVLGRANIQYLLDCLMQLAGEPAGGYTTVMSSGKDVDFRQSDQPAASGSEEREGGAERPGTPEHAPDLE